MRFFLFTANKKGKLSIFSTYNSQCYTVFHKLASYHGSGGVNQFLLFAQSLGRAEQNVFSNNPYFIYKISGISLFYFDCTAKK